jgi:hypothetical protein
MSQRQQLERIFEIDRQIASPPEAWIETGTARRKSRSRRKASPIGVD